MFRHSPSAAGVVAQRMPNCAVSQACWPTGRKRLHRLAVAAVEFAEFSRAADAASHGHPVTLVAELDAGPPDVDRIGHQHRDDVIAPGRRERRQRAVVEPVEHVILEAHAP